MQVDLNLRLTHMSKGTFSDVTAGSNMVFSSNFSIRIGRDHRIRIFRIKTVGV